MIVIISGNIIELISDEKDVEVLKRIFYVLLIEFRCFIIMRLQLFFSISPSTGNKVWIKRWENESYDGFTS